MSLSLDAVQPELARMWQLEAGRSASPRMALMTLVAIASEPSLLSRAREVCAAVARGHAARTIVASARPGTPPAVTAEVALHRLMPGGNACGDAIVLDAVGDGREWLPEAIDRLVLTDLPVCVWWVGDLPDDDDLFDRLAILADMVVVNSDEMDLVDLEQLDRIVQRSHGRTQLTDLTWVRLRSLQDLVARFFDDPASRGCLAEVRQVGITFAPRRVPRDIASTQAALLLGWIAHALSLPGTGVSWSREGARAQARLAGTNLWFEQQSRSDVTVGSILSVQLECGAGRFAIDRLDDPQVFRWSRSAGGTTYADQVFRLGMHDEAALLLRTLEQPRRDPLLEATLHLGSDILRSVAQRPAGPRRGGA